jgi:hypothetical protein
MLEQKVRRRMYRAKTRGDRDKVRNTTEVIKARIQKI